MTETQPNMANGLLLTSTI